MNHRDQISIQSQSILWVAGVGVGLLTLAFVLGVQVGKQSAALRRPTQKGVEEELKDLPEPLIDQLKIFEGEGPDKLVPTPKVEAVAPVEDIKPKAEGEAPGMIDGKNEGKNTAKTADKPAQAETWTLQLVATADAAEAKLVADKARAAGFATTTLRDKNQLKVRLVPGDRKAMDGAAEQLTKSGLKPFAMKIQ